MFKFRIPASYKFVGLLVLLSLSVPLVLYYLKFRQLIDLFNNLSINLSDWGAFGDFFNVWVSVANLILFSTLTIFLHQYEKSRNLEVDLQEKARNRPILVFIPNNSTSAWDVKNVGVQVALNIYIMERNKVEDERLTSKSLFIEPLDDTPIEGQLKRYSAISPNDSIELRWATQASRLFSLYQDIFQNDIVTLTVDNETIILTNDKDIHSARSRFPEIDQLFLERIENRAWNNN